MNGRVLFDFMFDQFVWPAHPFAGRDVRTMNEPEPKAGAFTPIASEQGVQSAAEPSGSLIVLADQRKKTT